MATMTLKNVPDELYEMLKRSAERHRRSINREAIVCLERALGSGPADTADVLRQARALRGRATDLFITDAELQAAKAEGRP